MICSLNMLHAPLLYYKLAIIMTETIMKCTIKANNNLEFQMMHRTLKTGVEVINSDQILHLQKAQFLKAEFFLASFI